MFLGHMSPPLPSSSRHRAEGGGFDRVSPEADPEMHAGSLPEVAKRVGQGERRRGRQLLRGIIRSAADVSQGYSTRGEGS